MFPFSAPNKIETPVRIQITRAGNASVAENTTAVRTMGAVTTSAGTISWSMTGGDSALFTLGAANGVLAFTDAPDFETPGDANADNVYVVPVTATWDEESITDTVTLYVTVTDVAE